ncbi:MAG: preprotein translocase subunit SecD [Euryarchaeota archaeon]|nr:preprotein translocase subunit SecD [Euryarchaeota archaeon]
MSYEEIFRIRRVQVLMVFVGLSLLVLYTNGLSLGWDLSGGSELKVKTEYPLPYVTPDGTTVTMELVVEILEKRLNGLGIKDFSISPWGTQYLIIDFAGTQPEQARELIERQGKLVVKVGNRTAFTGAELVRIAPYTKSISTGKWQVPFTISEEAAQRFREVALLALRDAGISPENVTNFEALSRDPRVPWVEMYLDDVLVNSAPIGGSLWQEFIVAGKAPRDLVLETGSDEEAEAEARSVEVVLRSGALPIKLEVISVSSVPPELGMQFARNAAIAGFFAIVSVALVVFLRYRRAGIVLPIIATGVSEVIIILGVASLIRWDLDLPAIAGIIAAVGTGVDDQIVITDEVLLQRGYSMRSRIKRAFFIIFSAWFTTVAAMVPLFMIGMAALKGFAITTILGVTIGVLITRPAYAKVVEHLFGKTKKVKKRRRKR